jgi:hypothetical protein
MSFRTRSLNYEAMLSLQPAPSTKPAIRISLDHNLRFLRSKASDFAFTFASRLTSAECVLLRRLFTRAPAFEICIGVAVASVTSG